MKSLYQYVDQVSSMHLVLGPTGGPCRQSFFASKNATSRATSGGTGAGSVGGSTISGKSWTPVKSNTVEPAWYDDDTPKSPSDSSATVITLPLCNVHSSVVGCTRGIM